ncbi:MAG: HAD family phosphatase [Deltaproteobacteria bacterium]|nr:HAD family phosphatase [Deltaproteobacteria bacterium]
MTNPKIEAVIFDLGRVLVDIDNTLLVEQLFKGLDTDDLQELGRRTMSDPAMVAFNSGKIGPEAFYEKMRQTYHWDLTFDAFRTLWCRIFVTMDGVEALVAQLHKRVNVGLLSDTDPLHWNHIIATWPWIGEIKNPTLSYQVGVMKPNPEIYLTAADNVNTPPQKCLYIDDLEMNVKGARAVGMTAIRFENAEQLKIALEHYKLL